MSDEPQPPAASARTAASRPMTLDEKRARQRAYVKKSYYRQQNTVNALKQQLRQLEAEYRRLSRAVVVFEPSPPAAVAKRFPGDPEVVDEQPFIFKREQIGPSGDEEGDNGEATTALTNVYAQLTLLKEELRKENRVLADNVREHERFQQHVDKCVVADKASNAQGCSIGASASAHTRRRPPPVLIKPFTVDECQTLTAKCYAEAVAITQSSDFESSGVSAFGWRDERRVFDSGRFNFSLKKFFFGRTATQLSQDSWWVNLTRLQELYPSQMDLELHVIQEVDADSVIMYRVIHSLDGQFADKTLFLTTRFRTDNGYVILFQSLDPEGRLADVKSESEGESPPAMDDFQTQHEQERWRRLQTWVFFEEAGENAEHCLYCFGGAVPTNSAVWMLEILLIALRWESIVVGPVFSIC